MFSWDRNAGCHIRARARVSRPDPRRTGLEGEGSNAGGGEGGDEAQKREVE